MSYENVNLWFAKIENGNIVTIDEVDRNHRDKYYCPMCGSELIPKAIKEDTIISSHFAHVDKSKCSGEGMVHFWFKNKLLTKGDKFIVKTNASYEYICEEILVEQSYTIGNKVYKPDVTIITKCGTQIFFEMNYSNKKKIEDYIDIWMELGSPVVEVDVKVLMNWNKDELSEFKALFYKGKCFNVRKNDLYYNTVGKYKEELYNCGIEIDKKERIKKLDWLWIDINKYQKCELNIDYMVNLIDCIDEEEKEIVEIILNKSKCTDLLKAYLDYKCKSIYDRLLKTCKLYFGENHEEYITSNVGYSHYAKKITGEIQIHDIKERSYYSYNVLKDNNIIEKATKYLDGILKEKKDIENLQWAKNNTVLADVVDKINKKYKEIDIGYNFYNRFGYSSNLCFAYNYNTKVDFKLPNEVIYSQDYSFIENYCNQKIESYFLKISTINNKTDINNLLNNINSVFNNINIVEKRVYESKIGKRRYKTIVEYNKFIYGIEYRWTAQNCIRLNPYKKDMLKEYNYQLECCKNMYIYIINNGVYINSKYIFDSNIEINYEEELKNIGYFNNFKELEVIIRKNIAACIRKDRYKI